LNSGMAPSYPTGRDPSTTGSVSPPRKPALTADKTSFLRSAPQPNRGLPATGVGLPKAVMFPSPQQAAIPVAGLGLAGLDMPLPPKVFISMPGTNPAEPPSPNAYDSTLLSMMSPNSFGPTSARAAGSFGYPNAVLPQELEALSSLPLDLGAVLSSWQSWAPRASGAPGAPPLPPGYYLPFLGAPLPPVLRYPPFQLFDFQQASPPSRYAPSQFPSWIWPGQYPPPQSQVKPMQLPPSMPPSFPHSTPLLTPQNNPLSARLPSKSNTQSPLSARLPLGPNTQSPYASSTGVQEVLQCADCFQHVFQQLARSQQFSASVGGRM
jgi:hypothetical protein